ncbi:hypothetical protein PsorP6_016848 [Peronosclerospora sorghi]|uniref:Uncharacterized protein n=1 Tax=Peronosclerospora sorghi TaxID=230839 RepID=A0ACC0WET0_9STRA|nr:hypothetical protein PsorP6_016848 [Peronosclerospora sorghi]
MSPSSAWSSLSATRRQAPCVQSCQFCLNVGREAKPRAKRKRTSHAQCFTAPFSVDVYTRHHENAHPERWTEFQQLSTDEKSNYFENSINHASTLLAHFDSHGALTLTFNRDIVEKMIGDLLFDVDDESIHLTRAWALSVFKLNEDAPPRDNAHVDLVAQEEYRSLADDTFVTTLTGLIAYLRRKQNLTAEMKTTCLKFVSSRWLSMKRVTE